MIPNATVYTSPVTVNNAYQRRRCEFIVGIGYEDDVQKAKSIIMAILDKDQLILSQPAFNVNVTQLADFSINLTVTWWVDTQENSTGNSISTVQEHVIEAFAEHGISIPYPVQEVKVYRGENTEDASGRAKQST